MERAWNLGIKDLTVQLDSLCAVQLLPAGGDLDHQHSILVSRYNNLLHRDWRLKETHIFREGNGLADSLASRGFAMDFGVHSINISDSMVQYWAMVDRVGGAIPRQIAVYQKKNYFIILFI
ncbi:Putative ribonuclease H protein At1g65750 [Linum perenne]